MKTALDLDQTNACGQLRTLAKETVDLTAEGTLTPQRIERFASKGPIFNLHYAFERVDHRVLKVLQALCNEMGLVDQHRALAAGARFNQVEGWTKKPVQVLHMLNRGHPNSKVMAQEREFIDRERKRMCDFLQHLDPRIDTFVQIGIGGSELGPRAMVRALEVSRQPDRRVFFMSNVDPDHACTVLDQLELDRTLFAVVSKSGSTLETSSNESLVRHRLEAAGLHVRDHMVSITTPASLLDNETAFKQRFYMLPAVGGRFSTTSPVGEFCLRFALPEPLVDEFLDGARVQDEQSSTPGLLENQALLAAALNIWNQVFLAVENHAVLPYAQVLDDFVLHLQQCSMESNGKSINRRGIPLRYPSSAVLWGAPGTNSQHSFFQQLHQGTSRTACTFIGFRQPQHPLADLNAHRALNQNMIAQMVALAHGRPSKNPNQAFSGNRPSRALMAEQLNARSLGALLSFYENQITYEGLLLNVNSFDQEGVQLGKMLANALDPAQTELRQQLGSLSEILEATQRNLMKS